MRGGYGLIARVRGGGVGGGGEIIELLPPHGEGEMTINGRSGR